MLSWLRSSLPARAGFSVAIIATFAMLSAFSAGLIAWISEKDAAAINTAGSARMATYRLSWHIEAKVAPAELRRLTDDLEQRLESPNIRQALELHPSEGLAEAHRAILARWREDMRPALVQGQPEHFLRNADSFVAQLDALTRQLQQQSERRQNWQLMIQGTALLITVMVLLIGMYELESGVIRPLHELVEANEKFRSGEFSARVDYRSEDELGKLALSFNAMASTIEESHRTLESRVAQKTRHLEVANTALGLLLQSSRHIATTTQTGASVLEDLITRFQQQLPGLELTLCLTPPVQEPAGKLISLQGNASREICSRLDCSTCDRKHAPEQMSFDVLSQGQSLGELRAAFRDQRPPADWESELIQALADLVGTALMIETQREQKHWLVLMDERNTIARELHDSLAQALTYLNMQASRLDKIVQRNGLEDTLGGVIAEMRNGIESAYQQLRELLVTFRLRVEDGGLAQAMDDAVQEFSRRGNLHVTLAADSLALPLAASEQVHLLQIMREALSNCVRHSRASEVQVRLAQNGEQVELAIEDDGVGLSLDFDQRQHHGIAIMRERASSLKGTLSVTSRQPHGTAVRLSFSPHFLGAPPERSPA
ncbi:MAG: narX [Moraxellaceae bacterium]|jgi:two-component system nitrate/nitrite sensor histidine kinase NarX|nr:narX [Moraxellaceae bacterium]